MEVKEIKRNPVRGATALAKFAETHPNFWVEVLADDGWTTPDKINDRYTIIDTYVTNKVIRGCAVSSMNWFWRSKMNNDIDFLDTAKEELNQVPDGWLADNFDHCRRWVSWKGEDYTEEFKKWAGVNVVHKEVVDNIVINEEVVEEVKEVQEVKIEENKPIHNTDIALSYATSVMHPIAGTATIAEIHEIVRGDMLVEKVAAIRAAVERGDEDAKHAAKKKLPIICSGIFSAVEGGDATNRKKERFVSAQCMVVDIDHLPSTVEWQNCWKKVCVVPEVAHAFKSPSGDGIKCIITFDKPITDSDHYSAFYSATVARLFAFTSCHVDDPTRDVARACFLSHDPDAYYNPKAIPVVVNDVKVIETTSTPVPTTTVPSPVVSDDNVFAEIKFRYTVYDCLREFGTVVNKDRCACPLPGMHPTHRNNAIFAVLDKGEGWYCHSCLVGGDSIELYQRLRQITKGEAVKELKKKLGIKDTKRTAPEPEPPPVVEVEFIPDWRKVNDKDVRKALSGLNLDVMVDAFSRIETPHLPLAVTLSKAVALASCALTGETMHPDPLIFGIGRARVIIDTAGGQPCNSFNLVVLGSSKGKDIGRLLHNVVHNKKVFLGTSGGSVEGLKDRIIKAPNGLLMISEFAKFFDKGEYEAKSLSAITDLFDAGYFSDPLSTRGKVTETRSTQYCFPSIIAHVQPNVLRELVQEMAYDQGFMARQLIYLYDGSNYVSDPITDRTLYKDLNTNISDAYDCFLEKKGVVPIDYTKVREWEQYVKDHCKNEMLCTIAERLRKQYGPRLAVMLSVPAGDRSSAITITDDTWKRVVVLLNWFFKNAESLLDSVVFGDERTRRWEKHLDKVFHYIKIHSKTGKVTKTMISRNIGRGLNNASYREQIYDELIARGKITFDEKANIFSVISV